MTTNVKNAKVQSEKMQNEKLNKDAKNAKLSKIDLLKNQMQNLSIQDKNDIKLKISNTTSEKIYRDLCKEVFGINKKNQLNRNKIRTQLLKHINNCLVFDKNLQIAKYCNVKESIDFMQNNEKGINALNEFIQFYKNFYCLNDFSIQSIVGSNKKNNIEIVEIFLQILSKM